MDLFNEIASKPGLRIEALKIKNYLGIKRERTVAIGPQGSIVSGGNAVGKTSILKGIRDALISNGVKPENINGDADMSRISVTFDRETVTRTVTRDGDTSLKIERDGARVTEPAKYLKTMIGSLNLDPLSLLGKTAKEQRDIICASMPMRITRDELAEWWPDCPAKFYTDEHAIAVVENARKTAYADRTQANKNVKTATDALARASKATRDAKAAFGKRSPGDTCGEVQAEKDLDTARTNLIKLEQRKEQAAKHETSLSAQRAKVADLRKQAVDATEKSKEFALSDEVVDADDDALDDANKEVDRINAEIAELEKLLANAKQAVDAALQKTVANDAKLAEQTKLEKQATDATTQADTIESAIAATAPETVTDDDIATAKKAVDDAQAYLATEQQFRRNVATYTQATRLEKEADTACTNAEAVQKKLDDAVKALTAAPAALLAKHNGIPGLSIDGDTVMLDGKPLAGLCGAEQLEFCVEIARRGNAKTRIILCDELERLDPERREKFIRDAVRGGYQLIATLVTNGDLMIEDICVIESDGE